MTMTQGDRLDVDEPVSRQGAHRAKPNPVLALLPFLAVAAVVLSVIGLAWMLFGRGASESGNQAASGTTASVLPSASASSGATQSATDTSSAGATESTSAEPSTSAESSPTSSSASSAAGGQVNKTIRLDYYNGTSPSVPGQARKAEAELRAQGWTNTGSMKTWTGPNVTKNTVYYADASQLSTARAVVNELGGGTVKLNTNFASVSNLGVVVGNNYQP